MNDWYIGSDYAGITTRNIKFYYGYERTKGEDWCFVAKPKGEEECVIPYSNIEGVSDMFNVEECLLAGIAMFLGNYRLELD